MDNGCRSEYSIYRIWIIKNYNINMESNIYKRNIDGTVELIETIIIEEEVVDTESIIADKEEQLLQMYEEIQALKNNK